MLWYSGLVSIRSLQTDQKDIWIVSKELLQNINFLYFHYQCFDHFLYKNQDYFFCGNCRQNEPWREIVNEGVGGMDYPAYGVQTTLRKSGRIMDR